MWDFQSKLLLTNVSKDTVDLYFGMVFQIRISGDPSWIFFSMKTCGSWYNMLNRGVLEAWRWALPAACGIFSKTLALFEISTLLAVFGRFCMGVLWRGFDWKMPIFSPWSGILAGCSARRGNFLKKCKGLITYNGLFGQLASRRVRRVPYREGRLVVPQYFGQ